MQPPKVEICYYHKAANRNESQLTLGDDGREIFLEAGVVLTGDT